MSRKFWTPEQDALILMNADKSAAWDGWKELLPERSRHSINIRRYVLGVSPARDKAKWTKEQKAALAHGMAEVCKATGHNPYECMNEMRRLLALAAAKKREEA